jgi:branched-chain amino acid transport system ATP-binding protein
MSGGEQQMLGLARAFIRRPRLVLVDEVSMGLAPVIVDQIYDFLGRLVAEGTSLLVVEQFIDKALSLAGTAHILHKGELRFSGPTADLAHEEVFAEYLGVA